MTDFFSLARTEWLKLKGYRPFWLVFVLYPVCLGGVVAIAVWAQFEMREAVVDTPASTVVDAYLPFAFPRAWQSVAYLASWLHFIPAVLLVLNVTNEFAFRSHRQNLLEGWSRIQFLEAKATLAFLLCLYCTALTGFLTIGAGGLVGTPPTVEGSGFLALFLLQSLVYAFFVLALAFVIRRAALALAAFFLYSIILENILAFLLNLNWAGLGGFLPLHAAGSLLPLPFLKENAPEAAQPFLSGLDQATLVAVCLCYIVLFLGSLWFRFRREDL